MLVGCCVGLSKQSQKTLPSRPGLSSGGGRYGHVASDTGRMAMAVSSSFVIGGGGLMIDDVEVVMQPDIS